MFVMTTQLQIDGITIYVTRKNVKNINLRVYPSQGRVALSCPYRTKPAKIADFARNKLSWIKKHLENGQDQSRERAYRWL
jgi:predicted metal-dependent hydrolase